MYIPRLFIAFALCAALAVPCVALAPKPMTTRDSQISVSERAFIASKIYVSIPLYFAHWQGVPDLDLDAAYHRYLEAALAAPDRFGFDMATSEFMAGLRNSHTGFSDDWLQKNYGQPSGFSFRYLLGQWIVTRSLVPGLKPGQVIAAIDGTSFEAFYQQKKKYFYASQDEHARTSLSLRRFVFPLRFTLTTADGAKIAVNRRTQSDFPDREVEGRWLQGGNTAYVSIPILTNQRTNKPQSPTSSSSRAPRH